MSSRRRIPSAAEDRGFETSCLIYQGKLNPKGYPHNRLRRDWENANGPVPAGSELDHLCRQRDCVNLDHVEVVSHGENVRRSRAVQADHWIARLRCRLEWTQRELAAALGVSRALVALWEAGRHPVLEPHASRLRELAEGAGQIPEPEPAVARSLIEAEGGSDES